MEVSVMSKLLPVPRPPAQETYTQYTAPYIEGSMFRAAVSSLPGCSLPALAAVFWWKKEKKDRLGPRPKRWRKETHPYYNLTVRVLRAQNIHGADMLSAADCYVQLQLPTASSVPSRTKVVYNSSDPEWHETFHYRIHGAIKNILELSLYDRDIVVDDKITSIVFDVGNIKPGQTKKEVFKLNPKDKGMLEVEFHLEESQEPPAEIITNGVLVVHPCVCVEGKITNGKNGKTGNQMVKLSVPGSYEKQICAPLKQAQTQEEGIPFVFHADRDISPSLNVSLQQTLQVGQNDLAPELDKQTVYLGKGSLPFSNLPDGTEINISLPLSKEHIINMNMRKEESSPQELDIRLGFELSQGERDFLEKRKKIVAKSLEEVLQLYPGSQEVPIVAVLGSGGGTRAMTSFYGSLLGLQELKLLDSITYLSGVSGSTWCMCTLYEDSDWSQKALQEPISRAKKSVTSNKAGAFSADRLKRCTKELVAMEKNGHKVNFTDLWGLVLEYFLHQKDNPAKLSDQKECVQKGQNPYPIYAGVNVRVNISGADFAEWCEFTPHEIGFRKYGAFIRTEDFDSEFFMGHLIQRRSEPKLCYLQGVWGSAFAANLDEIWARAAGTGILWLNSLTDVIRVIDDCRKFHWDPSRLQTRLVMPGGIVSSIFQDFFKSRFTAGEGYNFTRGLYLYKDYKGVREFLAWKGNHLDAFPNQLTPMEENLYLVDGGFSINSPFPLVLQPERDVDVILSFNYSWQAPFEVLHLTKKYCKERGIAFPSITVSEQDEQQPKECYVFMDKDNPRSPIVVHFPLVNDTFRTNKEPGILRGTDSEVAYGNFVLSGKDSPYRTKNFTYEPNDFDRLVEVNRYNVINNKEQIMKAIKTALDRRKQKM